MAQSQTPPAAATARHSSAHPQLRLPLSHHGLPRPPTSPESSYSTRSQRYEPLERYSSDSSARAATVFRFSSGSTTTAPLSPPMTPFSPSAFPSEQHPTPTSAPPADDKKRASCCHRCSCNAHDDDEPLRSRSAEYLPGGPVQRHASTRSLLATPPEEAAAMENGGAVAAHPASQGPSPFVKIGKKIRAALGPRKSHESGLSRRRLSRRGGGRDMEVEEIGAVHWTEM